MVGDPERPPHRQPAGPDSRPQARESVAELEDPPQIGLSGIGGHPEGGGELHRRELRDQRRTLAGDRDRLVAEEPVVGDLAVRVDLVEHRPLDRQVQLLDLDPMGLVGL